MGSGDSCLAVVELIVMLMMDGLHAGLLLVHGDDLWYHHKIWYETK
jgi:hypothetical protein